MLRQLLTLLAVFTGLTAAVEPARALEASVARVELAQQQRACGPVLMLRQVDGVVAADAVAETKPHPRPTASPCAPTIQLRADRALE